MIKAEDGLQKLIEFLKTTLGKEDIEDISQKWDAFENCRRKEGEKIVDFVDEFERKYNRIVKMKISIPEDVRALMIMKRSQLSEFQRILV